MTRTDISDNMNTLIDSIDGIEHNWDNIIADQELTDRAIKVIEQVSSFTMSIQLLLNFHEIWLTDEEHEQLEAIRDYCDVSLEELSIDYH